MIKIDMQIHIFFDDIEEREIYDRLDTVIQFLIKNKMRCTVVLDRHEFIPEEGD